MDIFLQPAGEVANKQLEITIYKKEKLENLKEYITTTEYNDLKNIYPNKELNMWGVTINKENVWKEMKVGDIVLFYGNKKFFVKGKIQYKIHNKQLAKNTWGADGKGLCWEHIFFLDDTQNINIPIEKFNEVSGYKFKHVQGAIKVSKEHKEQIFTNDEDILNIDYRNLKYHEEKTKIQKLKEQIWNIDINNANDDVKIVTLKEKNSDRANNKVKRNYNKNSKEKSNALEHLSDKDKYHLGVQGELYIYKLLKEKNSLLLKELNLLDKEVEIICYNKEYNSQEDWEDKSINKGHDILVKSKKESEEIYLEIKTSIEDTKLFSMTGNELKLSKEKGEKYYIIKIVNFVEINKQTNKSKLKVYCIRNPYQILEKGENIKEISIYLND